MRYAIVSDLHGNRQAWNAVLADARTQGVEEIICLGDVVGYGPAPAEVLESAYSRVRHFVLGNHDAALAELLDTDAFNEHARQRIEWTASQVDDKAVDFFTGLPLLLEGEHFCCAHGTPRNPEEFDYLLDSEGAESAWAVRNEPVCFVGHTHAPALFVTGQSGRVYELDARDFALEPEKRYIVNPGSVGQPRDGDVRAAYCIYDALSNEVFFRKVAFDVEGYRDDLKAHRLSEEKTWFLNLAAAGEIAPVRELLDFRPREVEVKPELEQLPVRRIEEAYRKARHWRMAAATAVALLCLVIGSGAWLWNATRDSFNRIEAAIPWTEVVADSIGDELLRPPQPREVAVNSSNPLNHWQYIVADPEKQRLQAKPENPGPAESGPAIFDFKSELQEPFKLMSAPVSVPAGGRVTAKAQFKNRAFQAGYIQVAVYEILADGTRKLLLKNEPKSLVERPDRWLPTSITLEDPLEHETRLQYALQGQMLGHVQVRKCSFFRRE
ncbi:MAG: metallophosphoesterase family protein [Lentisphaeria bacterium]